MSTGKRAWCRGPPNSVMLHTRMLDSTAQAQQEALGVLGVNLIHGVLTKGASFGDIIDGLMDDLSRARIEVCLVSADDGAGNDMECELEGKEIEIETRMPPSQPARVNRGLNPAAHPHQAL